MGEKTDSRPHITLTGKFARIPYTWPTHTRDSSTGHGHFSEYYHTHNIREPANCSCGAELYDIQTREHIVFECQTHEEYGDIIEEGALDHQHATLFDIKTGIGALAEFVRKSKALQKTRATEIP